MALRASAELNRKEVDLHALRDRDRAAESGVLGADVLCDFASAVVARDEKELKRAREALDRRLGPEALVDAAAVAANFQRMVRIADSTGIPLDTPVQLMTHGMREELGFDSFGSAVNTPAMGLGRRAFARVLQPIALSLLRLAGRRAPPK